MVYEKTISDLLFKVYTPAGDQNFFDHILEILEHYIPAAFTGYSFSFLSDRSYQRQVANNLRDGCSVNLTGVNSLFQDEHPFWPYYMQISSSPVISTLDVIALEDWKQTEFYKKLSRPSGVMYDTSMRFYIGDRCVSYTFHDARPISSDHKRLLNMVVPHLNNAYSSYCIQRRGVEELLPDNMILISADGKIEQCSPSLIPVISSYYPLDPNGSSQRLPEAVERWVEMHLKEEPAAHVRNITKPLKISVRREGCVLTLRLIRIRRKWALTVDESHVKRPYQILMNKGLTERESEILLWASQGNRNNEIATILGISTATVRKHMEHTLLKFECENRGFATQQAVQMIEDATGGCLSYKCMTCALPHCRNCVSYS